MPRHPTSPAPPVPHPTHSRAVLGHDTKPAERLQPTFHTIEHHPTHNQAGRAPTPTPNTGAGQLLLRKEVIQPHLPVRLPCYDLVLIASPTFDGSLPKKGLGHRLRVLPTFMT